MSAAERAYWAIIHANYTRAELIAYACWADELEAAIERTRHSRRA